MIRSLILLVSASMALAASPAFFARGGGASSIAARSSVFGVSRGGGLFGSKSKDDSDEAAAIADPGEKYPAMSEEEIEEWLSHIPVFAVTDSKGQGVVLRPDNDTSVFYFFMSPQMANATLQTLKGANEDMDLQISAMSLGKIWFNVLNAGDDAAVKLKAPNSADDAEAMVTKGVQYRLVPDTRDLMGARMLLTMDPADGEKLKAGGEFSAEDAQKAIQKAMTDSPKFKNTFNEIPVFMIQQMRLQKQAKAEDGNAAPEPVNLLPMYFNLQNMVSTWQQFLAQAGGDVKDVEPAINLMELHELVDLMKKESEIDFRNVLLIPAVGGDAPAQTAAAGDASGADPMAQMGGGTLGDD